MRAVTFGFVRWISVVLLCVACGGSEASRQQSTGPDLSQADEPARQVPQASTLVRQGESKLAAGDAAGAKELFERAIAENPNDARAHLDLGLSLELLRDAAAAERAYLRATELDDTLAEAHNNLGVLLRERGELEAAIERLNVAVRVNPRSASARGNLAMALEDAGDGAGAEEHYRAALQYDANNGLLRANLGLLLLALGRGDDAVVELRRAARGESPQRATLLAIGNGLRRAGDAGGAVEAMRAAIDAGDGQPTPALLAELALAQLAAGSRDTAIATLRQALALDERFAVGHYLLANMLAAAGQRPDAAAHYKRYLQLEPQGGQAAQARERLKLVQ